MELRCHKIWKSYGKTGVFEDFSLEMTPGVYGILGPNGAGKSTLISLLTTNEPLDEGQILLEGKTLRKWGGEYFRMLGYMPQHQALYPYFTGWEFLDYMAALKGMQKAQAKEQIVSLLKKVELGSKGYDKIRTYSGGMKRRLLLAAAFLGDPKVIILDEPTAGLDPKQRIRMRQMIAGAGVGCIVLVATHVVSDIEVIAKEVLLLHKGRILDQGTPQQLTEKIKGKVWEVLVPKEEADFFARGRLISRMVFQEEGLLIRYVEKEGEKRFETMQNEWERRQECSPNLEDVYLWHFGNE